MPDAHRFELHFGLPFIDVPEQFGDYETVKRRYYRWIEMGVLDAVLAAFACEADLEWLMIELDHRASASARSRRAPAKRGADAQGLGRSRGGLSTKIHAAGDALGNPVRLIGTVRNFVCRRGG